MDESVFYMKVHCELKKPKVPKLPEEQKEQKGFAGVAPLWLVFGIAIFCGTMPGYGQWSEGDLVVKIAEKEEQIRKVHFEQSAIEAYLEAYDENTAALEQAAVDLESVRTKLALIQRNNLVKLTIRMAITTWKECKDAADLATKGVEKILSSGYVRGLLATAYNKFKDKVQEGAENAIINDPVKAALGLDEESLSSPYTVKIGGVNRKAVELLPELKKVNDALNLSIEGAQALAWNRDNLDLGPVGALLYKNERIRDEFIPAAQVKLSGLQTELVSAAVGMEERLQWLQEERISLENMLNNYREQLEQIRLEDRAAAGLAARQSMRDNLPEPAPITIGTPPPDNPPYPVRSLHETDESFNSRWAAYQSAIQAIAEHRELVLAAIRSQSLTIRNRQLQLQNEMAEILQERTDQMDELRGAFEDAFMAVTNFRGERIPGLATDISLSSVVEQDNYLRGIEERSSQAVGAISEFRTWDEQIREKSIALAELVPWQNALLDLAASTQRTVEPYNYPVVFPNDLIEIASDTWVRFGFAQEAEATAETAIMESASFLEQFSPLEDGMPDALTNIGKFRAKLAIVFPALLSLAQEYRTEQSEALANADYAMSYGIGAVADYKNAVEAFESVVGAAAGYAWRKGYRDQEGYVSWTVVPVIHRVIGFATYRSALAAALAAGEKSQARSLVQAYKTLCAQHALFQQRFAAANAQYYSSMDRIPRDYWGGPNWAALADWKYAHEIPNSTLAAPAPPDIEQMQHSFYRSLGYIQGGLLDYGKPWEPMYGGVGEAWEIPDPGVDTTTLSGEELGGDNDYAQTAFYDLLALQESWPNMTWSSMGESERTAALGEQYNTLADLQERLAQESSSHADAAFSLASGELNTIYNQYAPQLTITQDLQDQTVAHNTSATFEVAISGNASQYRWFYRDYYLGPDDYNAFQLAGETATGSFTTFALSFSRCFYVEIVTGVGPPLRSRIAQVTVDANTIPPSIWWDLSPQAYPAGMSVVLSIQYSSSTPCSVEWFKDGILVQSETATKLDLGVFAADKAGTYRVKVTNAANLSAEGFPASITLATDGCSLNYQSWAVSRGRDGWEMFDRDIDGLGLGAPNLLCYALGVETAGESSRLHPAAEISSGKAAMRFKKPKYVTGVNYIAETSTDLQNWTTTGVEMVQEGADAADEHWMVRTTEAIGGRAFLRLRVEENWP